MIEVALYLDVSLGHQRHWAKEYYDTFLVGVQKAIHFRILMAQCSAAIHFHIPGENPAWFAGALSMTRVLMNYTCAYVTGVFIKGPASQFRAAEITAENIYTESINKDQNKILEDLAYNIPTKELPEKITFSID